MSASLVVLASFTVAVLFWLGCLLTGIERRLDDISAKVDRPVEPPRGKWIV